MRVRTPLPRRVGRVLLTVVTLAALVTGCGLSATPSPNTADRSLILVGHGGDAFDLLETSSLPSDAPLIGERYVVALDRYKVLSQLTVEQLQSLDRTDTRPLRAAAGHEFLVLYTRTTPPRPAKPASATDPIAFEVVTEGRRQPLPLKAESPDTVIVVSVRKQADAFLEVTDHGKAARINLRTGELPAPATEPTASAGPCPELRTATDNASFLVVGPGTTGGTLAVEVKATQKGNCEVSVSAYRMDEAYGTVTANLDGITGLKADLVSVTVDGKKLSPPSGRVLPAPVTTVVVTVGLTPGHAAEGSVRWMRMEPGAADGAPETLRLTLK